MVCSKRSEHLKTLTTILAALPQQMGKTKNLRTQMVLILAFVSVAVSWK